ncbi:MAG TPA: PQQ-dependent sugar dehydrogenase, partial [Pseudonocardiaceae bacterium]|nr:PQQ-dependent sugar dehydrogenase [Pseudonocardiaceae bacterium]
MPGGVRRLALLACWLLAGALVAAGCASFPEASDSDWRDKPEFEFEAGPQPPVPNLPGDPNAPQIPGLPAPPPPNEPPRPPEGCRDFDPRVVATCLEPVGAIVALPGSTAAIVAERTTGRLLRVELGAPPVQIGQLQVDPAGGGGVTGLALSPSYAEDELIYAYITTATDNQVVRMAPGDTAKPVLPGIPRGATGNGGGLATDSKGALLVVTGDAGNPLAATDPASLAGKVLRIDGFGRPAKDNPTPGSAVISSGLHQPAGLCVDPVGGSIWVTVRTPDRDALYRINPGEPVGPPDWTWPQRPDVAGCIASNGILAVTLSKESSVFVLRNGPDGAFTGRPETVLRDVFGRYHAAAPAPNGLWWLGTVNKAGGKPVSSDDRVVLVAPPVSGGGGGID